MFRGGRDEGRTIVQSCNHAIMQSCNHAIMQSCNREVNTIAYCLLPSKSQIANRKSCLPLLLHPATRLDAPHQFADEGCSALAGSIDVGRHTFFIERFAD